MGRKSGQIFFQRRHTDGQHEKMLDITNLREMPIKTTMRCHLTHQNGYPQKDKKAAVLVRTWRKGSLVHCVWGGIQTGAPAERNKSDTKVQTPYDRAHGKPPEESASQTGSRVQGVRGWERRGRCCSVGTGCQSGKAL